MTEWDIDPATSLAQLAATIARADLGAGTATISLYTNAWPGSGAPGVAAQATITLAKPCASIVGGFLVFNLAGDPGGMVMAPGIPRWARWYSGAGDRVADGGVTDTDGTGQFRIIGGTTPEGETSPLLLAGALVVLGATALS